MAYHRDMPNITGNLTIVRLDGTTLDFTGVIIQGAHDERLDLTMEGDFLVFETVGDDAPVYVPNVSHFRFAEVDLPDSFGPAPWDDYAHLDEPPF